MASLFARFISWESSLKRARTHLGKGNPIGRLPGCNLTFFGVEQGRLFSGSFLVWCVWSHMPALPTRLGGSVRISAFPPRLGPVINHHCLSYPYFLCNILILVRLAYTGWLGPPFFALTFRDEESTGPGRNEIQGGVR